MLRILIISTCVVFGLTVQAQNSELKFNTALKQIQDFSGGMLLIPLQKEPKSSGINQFRDPELMKIRESNTALIAATTRHFRFTQVAFFWENEVDNLRNGYCWTDCLMNANYHRIEFDCDRSRSFIVTFFDGDFDPEEEIIVRSKKVEKKKAQKEAQTHEAQVRMEKKIKEKIDMLREKMVLTDSSSTKKRKGILDKINRYEHYWEPSEFEKSYFYYSSSNTDFSGMLVNRLNPVEIVRNEKHTYIINYNYITRVHKEVNYIDQYSEAFEHLNILLEDELERLEKRFDSRNKLEEKR